LIFDPAIAEDGLTYERLALQTWFEKYDFSPIDGQKINTKLMFPNQAVKKIVKEVYNKYTNLV